MKSFLIPGLALWVVSLAGAQTTTLQPIKTTDTVTPVTIDTRTMIPQINPGRRTRKDISENETRYKLKANPANNLIAGSNDETLVRGTSPKVVYPGIGYTGYFPPDVDGSVSQNWVVESVNTTVAFFEKKTGKKVFEQDYSRFFQSVGITGEVISDPKTIYDATTKRWFTMIIEVGFSSKISKQLVAVSDDEDPNGKWNLYRIDSLLTVGSNDYWLDYPGFGFNKDTVVITGNMFGFTSGYAGNLFLVIPKAPLLAGTPVTGKLFNDETAGTTKVCVNNDTSINAVYCLGADSTTTLRIHAITGGPSNPTVKVTNVTVPTFDAPTVPVPGPSGHNMDRFDARIYNASYRDGSIVGAHGVTTAATGDRQVARWYEIRTKSWPFSGTPTLRQSGNAIGGPGEHHHMPAVNINRLGDISVLFTKSSSAIQADLIYSARKAADPKGVLGKSVVVARSKGLYGGVGENRWGDYFGVAVDPIDDRTFWGFGMVGRSDGGWDTYFTNWKLSTSGDNAVVFPAVKAESWLGQGTITSGNAASLNGTDANPLVMASEAATGVGQVASLEATYQTTLTPTTSAFLGFNGLATAPTGTTFFIFAWNTVTKKYDLLTSLPSTTAPFKFDLADDKSIPYVAADGKVKCLFRAILPTKSGNQSQPFSLKLEQLQLKGEAKPAG